MKTTLTLIAALLLAPLAVSNVSAQTVAVSQQQAIKKYPELAVAGSALNNAFVAEVNRRKKTNPAFFRAADWPMRLADELSAAPAPMVEPGPVVKKEVPAVAAASGVFEVSDPALRNGKADAGPALREAIGKAIAAGPGAEVRLPAGRFRIATAGDASWQLGIGGAKGLTVRGVPGETELIFGLPDKGGIIINGGDGVFLKDLIIDSDPLPFTQGTIKSVDEAAGTFTMTVDEGYPSLAEKWFRVPEPYIQMGVAFRPAGDRLKSDAPDYYKLEDWKPSETAGEWRMILSEKERDKAKTLAAGDRFVLTARGAAGFSRFGDCRESGFENVTVHASASPVTVVAGCEKMRFKGLKIVRRPGTTRLISSNADGIHCQQNRIGPLVEDCEFSAMADDAINLYCYPLVIQEVRPDGKLLCSTGTAVRAGDELQILNPREGRIVGEVKAAEVTTSGGSYLITLEKPVAGIQAGADHRTGDTIYNLSASGAGFVIRNNWFHHNRRHGVLARAGNGLIEGNKFEEVGGFGVTIANEPEWPEGPVASDIIVRGNSFTGGGYSMGYSDSSRGAAVRVHAKGLGEEAQGRMSRRITIENNTFVDPPGGAITIGAAEGVTIRNNTASSTGARSGKNTAVILLDNAAGVVVEGLTITGAKQWTSAVRVKDTVAPGAEGATIKDVKIDPAGAITLVQDERKWIDVTSIIDPAKDAVVGDWRRVGTGIAIATGNRPSNGLLPPIHVEGDYDLEYRFRTSRGAVQPAVTIPVADRQCTLNFAANRAGLELIDGKTMIDDTNPTSTKPSPIRPGLSHTVGISVRVDGNNAEITVKCDGQHLVRWRGALSSLSTHGDWRAKDSHRLHLGAHCVGEGSSVTYESIHIRSVSGEVRPLRAAETPNPPSP